MGLTAIDTGVLLAFLDRDDPFHPAATSAMVEAIADGPTVLPGIAYSESLVAVMRSGVGVDWFRLMLDRLRIDVGSCTQQVLTTGARLRAAALSDRRRRQWRLPDALIVAEAMEAGADLIVTTDAGWPPLIEGPRVETLQPTPDSPPLPSPPP